jgi:hypothetical protein
MKKADAFLAEGKYDEALSHYSDAVNRDSSNYQYVCNYSYVLHCHLVHLTRGSTH